MDDSSPYITLIYSIQAETEELAKRVQSLTSENINLKSEINKLTENSEKLKLENVALVVHKIQDCFFCFACILDYYDCVFAFIIF